MRDILNLINSEQLEFENTSINIVDGFDFNQKDTIERIYRYYNSKFEEGDVDREGNKKYFLNISKNPCKVTTKAIDFDTKDIRILTAGGGDTLKTWFFERDLKFWMKDKQFGKVLNRIFYELPVFGSVVLKIVKNKPLFVDLRNFVVEQDADTLDKANYIIEKHYYTIREFEKLAKEQGWKNDKKAMAEFRRMNRPFMMVYERYGEVEVSEGNWEYRKTLVADVGVAEVDRLGNITPYKGIELKSEAVEETPYWEFHLEKIPGRWLGVGVVETLFEPQVRINEIANLQAKGSYWNAARIFQCRDDAVNKNLKTDVRDGEVLGIDSEITQVDMGDRNLAYFNEEHQKWTGNANDMTFRYDAMAGQRGPAGTTKGEAQLNAYMGGEYFGQIRENVALDVKELLYNVIVPNFQTENTKEHVLRLAGTDLDELRLMIINTKATDELFSYMNRKGRLPDTLFYETVKTAITEREKQDKEKMETIPKGFYSDVKYKIDIDITEESRNSAENASTMFAAIQAVTSDPYLLIDPTKRKFFSSWLEARGVSLTDFESGAQMPSMENLAAQGAPMKGSGGGVSAPVALPQQQGTATKTL